MNHRLLFLPFAAFVVLSGYLGWQLGQPISETDIIERYALIYIKEAGNGAQASDCIATPHLGEEVRLVVRCIHSNGGEYFYFTGQRGQSLPVDNPQEPRA